MQMTAIAVDFLALIGHENDATATVLYFTLVKLLSYRGMCSCELLSSHYVQL